MFHRMLAEYRAEEAALSEPRAPDVALILRARELAIEAAVRSLDGRATWAGPRSSFGPVWEEYCSASTRAGFARKLERRRAGLESPAEWVERFALELGREDLFSAEKIQEAVEASERYIASQIAPEPALHDLVKPAWTGSALPGAGP